MQQVLNKTQLNKAIEKWRGRDKINILDLQKIGKKYRVRFEEPGQEHVQTIEFSRQDHADSFVETFGGPNNQTVAMPENMLKFDGWSNEVLFEMGHRLSAISLRGLAKANSITNVRHTLPPQCGSSYIPGKQRTSKDVKDSTITQSIKYVQEFKKTIYFRETEELDELIDWITKTFNDFDIFVTTAVTESIDENKSIVWMRKMVGDGSKTMELRAEKLDGKHYTQCKFMDILRAADGLAGKTCRRVFVKKGGPEYEEGCQLAAEEGRKKFKKDEPQTADS